MMWLRSAATPGVLWRDRGVVVWGTAAGLHMARVPEYYTDLPLPHLPLQGPKVLRWQTVGAVLGVLASFWAAVIASFPHFLPSLEGVAFQ